MSSYCTANARLQEDTSFVHLSFVTSFHLFLKCLCVSQTFICNIGRVSLPLFKIQ
jgi:hypothetical protein